MCHDVPNLKFTKALHPFLYMHTQFYIIICIIKEITIMFKQQSITVISEKPIINHGREPNQPLNSNQLINCSKCLLERESQSIQGFCHSQFRCVLGLIILSYNLDAIIFSSQLCYFCCRHTILESEASDEVIVR